MKLDVVATKKLYLVLCLLFPLAATLLHLSRSKQFVYTNLLTLKLLLSHNIFKKRKKEEAWNSTRKGYLC